jgi:hypothetical protein
MARVPKMHQPITSLAEPSRTTYATNIPSSVQDCDSKSFKKSFTYFLLPVELELEAAAALAEAAAA